MGENVPQLESANAKMYCIELLRLRMTAIITLIISCRQHDLLYSGYL